MDLPHQNWEPQVLRKTHEPQQAKVARAPTQNKNVQFAKKMNRVEAQVEAGSFELDNLGVNFKLALLKARTAKNWSQKELAEKINVKVAVITEYEQGKGTPDPAIISKLNRVLGVKLPKPKKPKVAPPTQ
uniref:Multiprotein-bridging factor 1c n=2 Tax=Lygus hesperus TaxID=30085 RepID=A0A0A9WYM8_LYGHE